MTVAPAPLLKIRYYGDPCLRKKSATLKSVGVSERMLIDAMIRTMYETDGVGLAAPQVGINQQLFVADMGDGPVLVVNPKVLKRKGFCSLEEGCLSFPGIAVKIRRPQAIEVEYWNENNQIVRKTLTDLSARIFLHEYDHCQGKLIVDYFGLTDRMRFKGKLKEIKKKSQQDS